MKSMLSVKIKNYRSELGLSQEALAAKLGVTAQAVSKWECAQAYPDIELLPELAAIFNIRIDDLFYENTEQPDTSANVDLPMDGVLRIVQVRDGRILSAQEYHPDKVIQLCLHGVTADKRLERIEVWGSIAVDGAIYGNVAAGSYVECEDVKGNASAGSYIECSDVNGNASAGNHVECGDVNGNVTAGGYVECGDVEGSVKTNGHVSCGDVGDSVTAGGNVECGDVGDDVSAGGEVNCGDIGGDIKYIQQ